jgi:protein-disulfide isomerase
MGGIIKLVIGGILVAGIFVIGKSFIAPAGAPSTGSDAALLAVTEKDWVRGASDAPVTLVEYTDFQCPACGAYYPILEQLSKDLEGKMKLVVRHYPLIQIHKNALTGARATEAAGRQGKFWEMYNMLYPHQAEWSTADDPMKSILPAYASQIGLDVDMFRKDMADSSLDDKINHDRETGNAVKVNGTPSFYVNGEKITNPTSVEAFKTLIEGAAKK